MRVSAEPTPTETLSSRPNRQLLLTILVLTFCRLIVNMTRRFAYAFAPNIALALGVPTTSVQTVIGIQAGVGVTSPLWSTIPERFGRKRVMVGALAVMGTVGLAAATMPIFAVFAVMMVVFGIGKMFFDPAMQAYLGDKVPYHQRGFAIGITELSWAGSLLASTVLVGTLLAPMGAGAVFAGLGALCLVGALVVLFVIPDDNAHRNTETRPVRVREAFAILGKSPAALGAVAFALCIAMANEIFFINFGAWMQMRFEVAAGSLVIATGVISAAEVLGEFSVIGLADRFGKRRLAIVGAVIASITYLLLLGFASSLPLALIGLFVLFLAVETAIVSSLALFTEVLPNARAVMMSGIMGAASFGRLSGSLIGSFLYANVTDFTVMGLVALIIGFIGVFALWRYVREDNRLAA